MSNEKQIDWNFIAGAATFIVFFLSLMAFSVYNDIRRSADQEVFLSNCVKSHNPTDCAVAYKATK